ncbi:hypothetical protein YG5714_0587 [Sulfolobus islandicus Y.G.57.14]|jgi:hypothetical protein|uniref:Uncharacterized protein n=1 Tax=Saccharolobus islandicus (strain Y.G.57.14 / Yellowstone \|nr:hypothetical protein YG5714_0587 [Sulfolobus islandicus Y.G.57.14]
MPFEFEELGLGVFLIKPKYFQIIGDILRKYLRSLILKM